MLSGGTDVSLTARGEDQPHEVVGPAGLVVGARGPPAAERLLSDDRASRLVVDVEIAGRVAELLVRKGDRRAIVGEDRAGQRVGRGLVAQLERLGVVRLGVRIDGQARPEQLALHRVEVGIAGLDDGRLDEPTDGVVTSASAEDARAGRRLRERKRVAQPCERAAVDHRAHEGRQVGGVSLADLADERQRPVANLGPERVRDIRARRRGALLPLVLERAAHEARSRPPADRPRSA